jgi:hypothetical protein
MKIVNYLKLPIAFGAAFLAVSVNAQTTVFSDDMSGTFATYWTSQSTTTGSASFSSGVLLLDNNAAAGQTWAYSALSNLTAPFNARLDLNPGAVTWAFNMRTLTTNPSNTNRLAFVLVASSTNFSTASGYAVRVGGDSPSTDPLELVYFTGGVNGTVTTIASGASLSSNQYASVRVVLNPSTSAWTLYGETGTSWTSPTAVSTLLGSGTNSTGTSITMSAFGAWSLHTTGASQDRTFDNFTITAVPEPSTYAAIAGVLALGGVMWHRRRKARSQV